MAAFIASQREAHGVPYAVSCRALGVSQSWFYRWKDGRLPPAVARREQLKAEIARLFSAREGKDGSPRVTAALRGDGSPPARSAGTTMSWGPCWTEWLPTAVCRC